MQEFKLVDCEYICLCDLMKVIQWTSNGAEAKHLIAEGKVKVNGEVDTRKRAKIYKGTIVEFNGKKVSIE